MDDASEMKQNKIPAVIAVVVVSVLTLFQGGYYSDYACWAGIISLVACVGLLFLSGIRSEIRVPWYAVLLVAIGFCAETSALLNGVTVSSLSETSTWFAIAGFALLCSLIPNSDRSFLYRVLGWAGVVTAILALLMFASVIPYEGSVNAGRLQYSFQYANAAALWFAVVFIVAALSDDKRLRIAAFFPLMALLFTQSMGTLAVFCIAALTVLILWYRKQQIGRICALFMQLICAIAGAVVVIAVESTAVPGVAALVAFLGFALLIGLRRFVGPSLEKWFCEHARASLGLIVAFVILIALLVLVFAFTGRLYQSSQTFIERLVQMNDAMTLLGTAPAFGIGPGGWAISYQDVQSAQYVATSVHNGYLQIALDAGLIGLILFVGLLVVGFWNAAKTKDWTAVIAVTLISVHAFFDFDFAFSSLLMLLVLLLPNVVSDAAVDSIPRLIRAIVLAVLAIVTAVGCIVGAWLWMQKSDVGALIDNGELDAVETKVLSDDLLKNDEEVRTAWLLALCGSSQWDDAVRLYRSWEDSSAKQDMMAAMAYYSLGDSSDAEEVLLDCMEAEPRNVELFETAERLFDEYGMSTEAWERYRIVREKANAPVSGVGSFLQNQKQF